MQFPLSFENIILWLAMMAIVLTTTSEFLSPYYGQTDFIIDQKTLRAAALVLFLLFVLSVLIYTYIHSV